MLEVKSYCIKLCLLLVIYYGFGQKMGQNHYCSLFQLKFDYVTVTLSLTVLSLIFVYKLTLRVFYFTPKFVEIEFHLHGQKNMSTLAQ